MIMGYGDIAALNKDCKIKTPNLDGMGRNGIVFTDAHGSAAVCTPSRYGILTGRYNWRSTLKVKCINGFGKPLIGADRTTMASMLKKQGYTTACIGKWHWDLTGLPGMENCRLIMTRAAPDYKASVTGGPTSGGFDYFFGLDAPNYPPYSFIENEHVTVQPDTFYAVNRELDCRAGSGIKNWSLQKVLPALQQKQWNYMIKHRKHRHPFLSICR